MVATTAWTGHAIPLTYTAVRVMGCLAHEAEHRRLQLLGVHSTVGCFVLRTTYFVCCIRLSLDTIPVLYSISKITMQQLRLNMGV